MQLIKHIKLLEKNIIDDKKNLNNLIDLLSYLENDDPKVVIKCTRCLQKTFQHLIPKHSLIYLKNISAENEGLCWLQDRYNDTVQSLLEKFAHEIFSISNLSLDVLMQFIKAEIKDKNKKTLNNALICKIIENLLHLSRSDANENLVLKFSEYLKFDDIRYASMKCLLKFMDKDDGLINHDLLFLLLKNLHSLKKFKNEAKVVNGASHSRNYFALTYNENESTNLCFEKDQQKLFADIWIAFIKKNHASEQRYKLIIGCLSDKVMPYMSCPLSLADVLTNAYNTGGSISLLALNGIFILINDYNLQYPDFYGKLYKILQPRVLSEKYRARFFYLLDLFLSSTHLPAYLVCAFIKRLSRLCLRCPTPAISAINTMVTNLMVRHPNCQFLVNRTLDSNAFHLECDPYIEEEIDPTKCRASESSLWELQTLQSHFYHGVMMEMRGLSEQLPQQQLQISHLFDLSYDDLIVKERKKKKVPTATLR